MTDNERKEPTTEYQRPEEILATLDRFLEGTHIGSAKFIAFSDRIDWLIEEHARKLADEGSKTEVMAEFRVALIARDIQASKSRIPGYAIANEFIETLENNLLISYQASDLPGEPHVLVMDAFAVRRNAVQQQTEYPQQ